MKKIEAIIRPSELEAAIAALSHAWIGGVTVDEVEGYGRQKGHIEIYRGAEYVIEMVPKLRVAVVVPDPLVPRVPEAGQSSKPTKVAASSTDLRWETTALAGKASSGHPIAMQV